MTPRNSSARAASWPLRWKRWPGPEVAALADDADGLLNFAQNAGRHADELADATRFGLDVVKDAKHLDDVGKHIIDAAENGRGLALGGQLSGRSLLGRPETLDDHFRRHGADFRATSADRYSQMAAEFFEDSQRRGLPTKVDADGVIRVCDPETNTFGAFNPDGTARTFFKPRRRIDYWNDQPGGTPWVPAR